MRSIRWAYSNIVWRTVWLPKSVASLISELVWKRIPDGWSSDRKRPTTMYDVHLRLIGKRAVDFILVLIELFSLGVTAESLRAKKRSKIDDFAPTPSVWSKISCTRGRHPPIIFAGIVRPMNALQLYRWHFSYIETL